MDWIVRELEGSAQREQLTDLYVSVHWIRSNILYMADDLDAALAGAAESHSLAQRVPNRTVMSGAASTLAQVLFLRGEYAEALRWADESLAVAEAIGNVSGFAGPAAVALAARVGLGLPTDADRYLGLIDQAVATGSSVQTSFRFIAEGLLAVGDLDRAERFVDTLRGHPLRSGRLRDAFISAAAGELLLHLGRYEEAERSFAHAIALAELIGSRSTLAVATVGAGELAAARGDRRASVRHLERALAIARETRLGRYIPRIERLLAGGVEAASQRA